MDIDKLEDRELDVAVAEARGWIKGIRYWTDPSKPDALWGGTGYTTEEWYDYDLPHYRPSADIAAAWELWKELKADGYDTSVYEEGDGLMSFYVCRDKCEECLRRNEVAICYFHDLDELPTAIARAYLKALKAKASD